MRLDQCVFHGMGPFPDWKLDLRALPEEKKLIAIVGKNGRGKTFSAEMSLAGACWRDTPSQGSLVKRATGSDSWLESTITYQGQRHILRHVIDGVRQKSGAQVLDPETREPLWPETLVSKFDAWADRNLPDRDVVFASIFAAQQSEGFVKMGSADRIDVILRVIGVARLERMAKAARDAETESKKRLAELVRRIADIRGGAAELQPALAAVSDALAAASSAEASLVLARDTLAARQAAASERAVRVAAREAADRMVSALTGQLADARSRLASTEQQLAGSRSVLAEAGQIRAASAALPAAEGALAELRAAYTAADAAVRAELDPWRDGAQRRATVAQRRSAALGRLADEQAILAAVASKGALKEAAEAERGAVAGAETTFEAVGAKHVAGLSERVSALRAGHEEVIDSDFDPKATSRRALETDDAASAAAIEVPRQLAAAKEKLRVARERRDAADRKLAEAERLAAREADLPAARADLEAADRELGELLSGQAVAVVSALARSLSRLAVAVAGKVKATEVEPLRSLANRLPALEAAEGRIAELEPQASTARDEVARLEAQVAAVELADPGPPVDVAGAAAEATAAEASAKKAHEAVTKTSEALARAREVEEKVAGLKQEKATVEADLSDWTRLALDHGRSGMQSAEVDAAGPELTTLVNDLLHNCYGPRFTVSVETQRLDSTGKKLIDECNIKVIDTESGTEKEVREHSGGERTILAEALSLGLTMLACSRAGFDRPTIVRDESGAALDQEAARAWIRMLRKAIEVTGADKLLFVSHNPELVRLADATIEPPARRVAEIGAAA